MPYLRCRLPAGPGSACRCRPPPPAARCPSPWPVGGTGAPHAQGRLIGGGGGGGGVIEGVIEGREGGSDVCNRDCRRVYRKKAEKALKLCGDSCSQSYPAPKLQTSASAQRNNQRPSTRFSTHQTSTHQTKPKPTSCQRPPSPKHPPTPSPAPLTLEQHQLHAKGVGGLVQPTHELLHTPPHLVHAAQDALVAAAGGVFVLVLRTFYVLLRFSFECSVSVVSVVCCYPSSKGG